jgi:hypothetical protein
MHDCIQIFTKVLDAKCNESNDFIIVDISRMLGNLTSVSLYRHPPLSKIKYIIGCHELGLIWRIIQLSGVR